MEIRRMDISDLRTLRLEDFDLTCRRRPLLNTDELRHILKTLGAYYLCPERNADHIAGHVAHLNGLIFGKILLSYPNLGRILGYESVRQIKEKRGDIKLDWVIGPAYSAYGLVVYMAEYLGARHGLTEKDNSSVPGIWRGMRIKSTEKVLIASEVMTTPVGSTFETKCGVRNGNPETVNFTDFAFALINHSPGVPLADGTPVVYCFNFSEVEVYDASSCPRCKIGSKAVKPKELSAWEDLEANLIGKRKGFQVKSE